MAQPNTQGHQAIADWIGDVVALEGHVEEAMDHQLQLKSKNANLTAAIQRFHDTVRDSKRRAEEYQTQYGPDTKEAVAGKGAELLGKAAGIIDRIRSDSISKALRDDFTAYNHLAISYTMLQTTAAAMKDDATRTFAEQGLRTYADLVQDINQIMPEAVVSDLQENDACADVDASVVPDCRDVINRTWKITSNG